MIKIRKTSRDPKGIQKASKRCPKGVQKASKLIQIRLHWNKNYKIPMQRTAENHAPYQSFSSEQKSQHMQSRPQLASGLLTFVSVLLSDMQAFSMSRCTGTVHKKQLNNPNAKTCKDLQRTLHHIRPHQTQSNLEVRRCRVSVLNKRIRY